MIITLKTVTVITQPNNVTGCVGGTAMFTCKMESKSVNINIISMEDITWWRRRMDDGSYTPQPIRTQGNNLFSITSNISGGILSSVLMVTDLRSAFIGPYWVGITGGERHIPLSDMAFLSIVPNGMCMYRVCT